MGNAACSGKFRLLQLDCVQLVTTIDCKYRSVFQETKMFILKWMKHMLEAEKKVVAMWEKYLPKAQNVK